MRQYHLRCRGCGKRWEEDVYHCPDCGGTLKMVHNLEDRARLRQAVQTAASFWDYEEFFSVGWESPRVTMGEGMTPLVRATRLGQALDLDRLYLKNEGMNPSGTFKDRCMSISFGKALELGAKAVVIGSAGNAGAAAAAYAARAGIPCYVMVPASTPPQRIALILHYGARVILVEGSVTDCIDLIGQVYGEFGWHNVTTAAAYNPFQADAEKAIAYEMARQLNWKVPDWVAVPVGGGGILTGIYEGFKELYYLGLTDGLPRMIGAQEAGCSPLVQAFKNRCSSGEIGRVEHPSGVAVAIADAFPLDGETALDAVYESGGWAEDAEDQEILDAQAEIGRREGIFAETASAAAVAAVKKLRAAGIIKRQETVACVITGNGVKELPQMVSSMELPKPVACDAAALKKYLAERF